MTIFTAPNKVLSTPTTKVVNFDNPLKKLINEMIKEMRKANGIGLAANQIGKQVQVIVIEVNTEKLKIPLTVVVNPKIVSASPNLRTQAEACLSLPGIEVKVPRHESIKIKGYNLKGKPIKIAAKGVFARIIQHEIDHLDGLLVTDRGKIVNENKD